LPLPLLAHQAPVLPLLLWRRARPIVWNGTALVIGSVAPDLQYIGATSPALADRGFTHSFVGQFIFCLPVTLFLVGLIGFQRLGEVLVARMHPGLRARFAWLVGAATDVRERGGSRRAIVSALVGSFSHLAFDTLTHNVLPLWLPPSHLRYGQILFTTPAIVQLVVSGCAALVTLWMLRCLSDSPVVPPAAAVATPAADVPATRPGVSLLVVLALLGTALGVMVARPAIRHPDYYFAAGRLYVWGHVLFVGACGAGLGVLIALTILAAYDRRRPTVNCPSPETP
jgi:membrane-bound metal-dependent hydrolase YbcI (DUF457 family)